MYSVQISWVKFLERAESVSGLKKQLTSSSDSAVSCSLKAVLVLGVPLAAGYDVPFIHAHALAPMMYSCDREI